MSLLLLTSLTGRTISAPAVMANKNDAQLPWSSTLLCGTAGMAAGTSDDPDDVIVSDPQRVGVCVVCR